MADEKTTGTSATAQASDSHEELARLIEEVEAAAEQTPHGDMDKVKNKPVKHPEEEPDCASDEAEAEFDLPDIDLSENLPMIGGGGLGGGSDDW